MLAAVVAWALCVPAAAAVQLGYMYDLSDTTGPIRENPGDVWYDAEAREVFVVGYGVVRVFSETGMEVHSFRLDPSLGFPMGVAALGNGDLLVLVRRDAGNQVIRCDFRGEPLGEWVPTAVPAELATGFAPSAIRRAAGKTFLADLQGGRVLVLDDQARFLATYDVARLLGIDTGKEDAISGFGVASDGSMLFTVATLFQAFVVAPDGTTRSWGKPGGAPGLFNVVKGIARDGRGRYYVVDALKSAVIVFDANLAFVGEFGYGGNRPGNLTLPSAIALGDGRVYVAQKGNRGVSVFSILEQ
jgi:DNA-binding beta-propeller fold protein YncE